MTAPTWTPSLTDQITRRVLASLGARLGDDLLDPSRVCRAISVVQALNAGSPVFQNGWPVTPAARDDLILLLAEDALPGFDGWEDLRVVCEQTLGIAWSEAARDALWDLHEAVTRRANLGRTGDVELEFPGDEALGRVRPEFRLSVAQERADSDVRDALAGLLALGQVTQ